MQTLLASVFVQGLGDVWETHSEGQGDLSPAPFLTPGIPSNLSATPGHLLSILFVDPGA